MHTVPGTIALDTALVEVRPSRLGLAASLLVRDGQRVSASEALIRIRSDEDIGGGQTMPERTKDALTEQDERLASRNSLVMRAASAVQARLVGDIGGITAELESLDAQIADQKRLVEVASTEFQELLQSLAGKGFISRRDLANQESVLILRRQEMARLEQARAAKTADLVENQRTMVEASASAQAQAAAVQSRSKNTLGVC